MTATTSTPAPTTASAAAPRVTGAGMLRAQWIQLTRQIGPLLGIVLSGGLLIGTGGIAIMAFHNALSNGTMEVGTSDLREIPGYGFAFAQLLFGVSAIVFVTVEWSSGAILATLAGTQRRIGLLWTKALIAAVTVALVLAVSCAVILLVAGSVLPAVDPLYSATDPLTIHHVVNLVIAGALSTLLAVGLAFWLRKTVVAIVTYVAIMLVAPIALSLIPSDTIASLSDWLPMNSISYLMVTGEVPGSPSYTAVLVCLILWAAGALGLGAWRVAASDVRA